MNLAQVSDEVITRRLYQPSRRALLGFRKRYRSKFHARRQGSELASKKLRNAIYMRLINVTRLGDAIVRAREPNQVDKAGIAFGDNFAACGGLLANSAACPRRCF